MTRPRSEFETFARRPLPGPRARPDRQSLADEAAVAGQEAFMEAAIAAAMIIAHADGEADLSERRRLVSLFRTNPMLHGFCADDVAREIVSHTDAFATDSASAVGRALAGIVAAELSGEQFRSLVGMCESVLDADGIRHPAEQAALSEIASMRPLGRSMTR